MAVGCIGMSVDDFSRCYFDEFEAICEAWRKMTESNARDEWERMRTLATISIQPHVRKRITPRSLLPMPWDNEHKRSHAAQEYTPEEKKKRFEELVKKRE